MVKGFSDWEKETIRNKLIEQARECFGRQGLKKTSISELTKAAGIAQGSFYLFFNSKEELFFKIVEMEEETIQQALLEEPIRPEQITKESFKQFILKGLGLAESSPIIRRIYVEDEYEVMLRKLPPDVIEEHIQSDEDVLLPIVTAWQQAGVIIDKKPEVIVSVIRSLFTVTLHKKEIGEHLYADTIDLWAELIASGLIKEDPCHD